MPPRVLQVAHVTVTSNVCYIMDGRENINDPFVRRAHLSVTVATIAALDTRLSEVSFSRLGSRVVV